MLERIKELKKQVGKKYQMFDESGNYLGCFYPVYFVYPDLPRYPLPSDNVQDNYDYGVSKILENGYEIKAEDVRAGDVLVTRFRDELHVALCISDTEVIHTFKDHDLRINKISLFHKRLVKFFRRGCE